jgi:hypothetical protein
MAGSNSLAAEGFQNVIGQGIEKRIGNREFAFSSADPWLADRLLAK